MASTSGGIILRQGPTSIFLVINKMGMVLVRTRWREGFTAGPASQGRNTLNANGFQLENLNHSGPGIESPLKIPAHFFFKSMYLEPSINPSAVGQLPCKP